MNSLAIVALLMRELGKTEFRVTMADVLSIRDYTITVRPASATDPAITVSLIPNKPETVR